MNVRSIVVALAVLFVAYVCGRAAGILIGVGPYPTEVAALAAVIAAAVWSRARRGR